MGFTKPDLLRQAGYDATDTLLFPTYGSLRDRVISTTSTTYTDSFDQFNPNIQWENIYPEAVRARVQFAGFIGVGTGETVDVRLRNIDLNETVVEISDISATDDFSQTADYTPSVTGTTHKYRAQIRTEPGSNSSTLQQPVMSLGVLL